MSAAKRRHQLEQSELVYVRYLLGAGLAVVAGFAAFWLDGLARVLFTLLLITAALNVWRPDWVATRECVVRRAVSAAIVVMLVADVLAENQPLTALARMMMLLLFAHLFSARGLAEERRIVGFGLLLVVLGGLAGEEIVFALHLALFVSGALLLFYLGAEPWGRGKLTQGRHWWRVVLRNDWRVLLPGVIFFALVASGGAMLFMSAPRSRAMQFPVLERFFERYGGGTVSSGFSDTMRFDDVSKIRADAAVAFRVEFGESGRGDGVLYWRMVVMDEYRDGKFRLSAGLRASEFGPREVYEKIGDGVRMNDKNVLTFYLEPHMGNFLPLPERFVSVDFTRPLEARVSESLGIVDLGRSPSKMRAYRVTKVAQTILSVPSDSNRSGDTDKIVRATLQSVVTEIRGDHKMGALQFARAASAWLGARHGYSLESRIGEGPGDPLVRWALSRESGHCELFAGALVLLMRTAGFQARVVAGFVGGEANGDYLIVRNSQAHAWCEIFDDTARDEHDGAWVRVDPTLLANGAAESVRSNVVSAQHGWAARADRWRLLWYKHVVGFGDVHQIQLLELVRGMSQWFVKWWRVWVLIFGVTIGAVWAWRRTIHRDSEAAARRKAARWLRRIGARGGSFPSGAGEALLRIRYGRRESWPELRGVWRAARREVYLQKR